MRRPRLVFVLPLFLVVLVAFAPAAAAHGAAADPDVVRALLVGAAVSAVAGAGLVAGLGMPRGGPGLRAVGLVLFVGGLVLAVGAPSLARRLPADECAGRAHSDARLEVVRPRDDERFASPRVPVEVTLEGGELAAGGAGDGGDDHATDGPGYLQIWVDGQVVTASGALEQVIDVPTGEHQVRVDYVSADGSPFCPPISVVRRVVVE